MQTAGVDYERLKELFALAIERDSADRVEFVRAACGTNTDLRDELLGLLDADRPEAAPAPSLAPGDRIGPYRVISLVGEGGMGSVFVAEETGLQRRVALKVVRSGLRSARALRRFDLEAEALGRLNHPGIARIYHAGSEVRGSALVPYFAMEYVAGTPLDVYVTRSRLDVPERVRLVVAVTRAVQHAHERMVIHRDLKPGNILVDQDGMPKVLDFGIARIVDGDVRTSAMLTTPGEILGTVPFMSPEQLQGDPDAIDARTDVYALGVLLYRTLAGRLPFDVEGCALVDAVHAVANGEPPRLGVVDPALRGDLDTIVAKALERDLDRRYDTARDLADDLERFLRHEPIHAQPPSATYRFRKFARRHRAAMCGALAVLVCLVAGIVATTREARRANARAADEVRARARAERGERSLEHTVEFLVSLFHAGSPERNGGQELTAGDLVERGVRRIDDDLAAEPGVRARLLDVMGQVSREIGLVHRSVDLLTRSVELHRQTLGDEAIETNVVRTRLGLAWLDQGEPKRAEPEIRYAELVLRQACEPGDANLEAAREAVAACCIELGQLAEADAHLFELLSRARSAPVSPASQVRRLGLLAASCKRQGHENEAFALRQQAWDLADAAGSIDEAAFLEAMLGFAASLDTGVDDDATRDAVCMLEEVHDRAVRRLGPTHSLRIETLVALGRALAALGRHDESLVHFDSALAEYVRSSGADSAAALDLARLRAVVLECGGRLVEAAVALEDVIERVELTAGTSDRRLPGLLNSLASLKRDLDEPYVELQRRAAELARDVLDDSEEAKFDILLGFGFRLHECGLDRESIPWLEQAVTVARLAYGEGSENFDAARIFQLHTLAHLGEVAAAEAQLRSWFADNERLGTPETTYSIQARLELADILLETGRRAEAVAMVEELFFGLPRDFDDQSRISNIHWWLAMELSREEGRLEEAATHASWLVEHRSDEDLDPEILQIVERASRSSATASPTVSDR